MIDPQTLEIITSCPPGTPIARFLAAHQEELNEAMRQTQMMLASACCTSEADNLSIPEKFQQLRKQFEAPQPSAEEVQQEINDLSNNIPIESTFPKPRVPVYLMTIDESQLYMQELLDYIVKTHLHLKATQFRKWPIKKVDGTQVDQIVHYGTSIVV